MKHNHAQNPSITNRIAALKARAVSALHANSSLKVLLIVTTLQCKKRAPWKAKEVRNETLKAIECPFN